MTPGANQVLTATVVGAVGLATLWFLDRAGILADPHATTLTAIGNYCMDCHDEETQSGGLVLDPGALESVGDNTEVWEKVARKISIAAMPPPDQPRPDEATYATMRTYLETELDALAAASPDAGYLPQLHRLTRTEYANAVRDLFSLEGLPAELEFELLLPADNASSGFDNIAELLFVSPGIMERYIDTAQKISRLVVGDTGAPMLVNRHRLPLQLPQDEHVRGLPLGTRGGLLTHTFFPVDGEYLVEVEFASRPEEPHTVEILLDGASMGRETIAPSEGGAFQRTPAPAVFRIAAAAGPANLGVTFVEHSQAIDESTLRVRRRSRGALPDIEVVTISGPLTTTGPGDTPSRRAIFTCAPVGTQDVDACARDILSRLARRAYRREVTRSDLDDLLPFFEAGLTDGGFEQGIQRAIERMLISPQFLYRIEGIPDDVTPGAAFAVTDVELASRLSFFLWSSIPDDELLDVAIAGELADESALDAQVERMLGDARSTSLVTNFAAQWLFLRDLESVEPDLYLFRDYDVALRDALIEEIERFVASILNENRSILDLLTANHTFVNERLADHYDIPNIRGTRFRRVELAEDDPRAGLLGKAGILTLTSYATRTSPVLRGKYVLDNLLASPPPAPPPDVPSLVTEDEDDGAALTMREALARHRADPPCAGCHRQMDAFGFVLENFDAVGAWRDWYADQAVDASAELPDGTRIDGVAGLRSYLTQNPERFARAFTEKLLMYALGRNIQYYDAPAVRKIVREAAESGYAFDSIVKGIVRSVPFRMRNAPATRALAAAGDLKEEQ
jgi:hypothetical protein